MKITFLLWSLYSLTSFAYTPTLESLLRNGNNIDIANNTVVANLKIKQNFVSSESSSESNILVQNEAIKLLIYNEREDYPKLVQLQYAGGKIARKNLHDIKVVPFHSLKAFSKNKESIDQRFFYAAMSMLLRNDGSLMLDFLQEQGIRVKTNKQLINKDKIRLLRDYKYYLKKLKDDSTVATDLKNPLRPTEVEDKDKVKEILKKPFLKNDELVKRHKNGDYFKWIVESDRLYISFDYDHRLEEISLKTPKGDLKLTCGRFLIQGSSMEFPQKVILKGITGTEYEIKITSLKQFADNSKAYYKRLGMYKDYIKENNIGQTTEKPNILL